MSKHLRGTENALDAVSTAGAEEQCWNQADWLEPPQHTHQVSFTLLPFNLRHNQDGKKATKAVTLQRYNKAIIRKRTP